MALDRTDKRILMLLNHNARMSFAAIGREIGLSRTAVQDRVSKLENEGIINGYSTKFSLEQAGLVEAIIFIKIAVRPCEPVIGWLSSLEGVYEVLSLSGEIDAIAKCCVASLSELSELNDRIGNSELIESSISNMILVQQKKVF